MTKIRIGIVGYGNLGRGVELAIAKSPDMVLKGVFTRRDPASVVRVGQDIPVYPYAEAVNMQDAFDVLILCGGSANDLPEQTPYLAKYFNVILRCRLTANSIHKLYKNIFIAYLI